MVLAAALLCSTGTAFSGTKDAAGRKKAGALVPSKVKTSIEGDYNIIFITTDQERYFKIPPAETNWRARDLLQSVGATFEKHYISSNMSTSSRSVIYTGQHITGTKMSDNTDMPWQSALREDISTIGDLMREAGYYTAYTGKFHMLKEGAVEIPGSNAEESGQDKIKLQRQDDLEIYGFSNWNTEGDIAGGVLDGYHSDEFIKGSAVRWLRDKGISLNKSGVPFFLAVNFINPHDIMYFNPGGSQAALHTNAAPGNTVYAQQYDYLPPAWEYTPAERSGIPAHREYQAMWSKMTGALARSEEALKQYNDYYLNCIQDQDNSLMGLLEELKRLGMMENTIIIYTSDHGEMGGSHGLTGKGNFIYESNLHVPFIVVHPSYKRSQRIGAVTSHLDITPTILDMTNLSDDKKKRLTKGLAGHSLVPLLDGRVKSVRSGALYANSQISTLDACYDPFAGAGSPDFNKRGMLRGVVTERYKFGRYFSPLGFNVPVSLDELYNKNDVELYDLENDPHELHNLAANREANACLIEKMNRQLNELILREIGADNGSEIADALAYFGTKR